jgi:hypothetical protein
VDGISSRWHSFMPKRLESSAGQSRDAHQEATRIALDEPAGIGAGPRQRTQELSLQSQTEIASDKRGDLNGSTQHRPEVQSADVSRLNSFESVDSKKTLPCLGLIEYGSKDQVSLKNTIGSTD